MAGSASARKPYRKYFVPHLQFSQPAGAISIESSDTPRGDFAPNGAPESQNIIGDDVRIRHKQVSFGMAAALAVGLVWAQDLRGVHLKGVMNDYSPANVSGGPWEIHGGWSLDIDRAGSASFTADVTMETSDYGVTSPTAVDPNNPVTRSPHTHHISATGASVSYDMSVCPANSPATSATGIVVTGTVTTTGNGSPAAFESRSAPTTPVCSRGSGAGAHFPLPGNQTSLRLQF